MDSIIFLETDDLTLSGGASYKQTNEVSIGSVEHFYRQNIHECSLCIFIDKEKPYYKVLKNRWDNKYTDTVIRSLVKTLFQ